MKYIISGLIGFLFTLFLSVPLQMVLRQREAKGASLSLKARANKEIVANVDVSIPPMAQVTGKNDPKEPKIKFMPQYPQEAAARQIEGFVTLSYTVAKDGSVQNVKITESSPPRVFDEAAKAAVTRWSYPAGKSASEVQSLRLNFNLNRGLASEQLVDVGF